MPSSGFSLDFHAGFPDAARHLSARRRSGKLNLNREWTPMDANDPVAGFMGDDGMSIHKRLPADWATDVIASRSFALIRVHSRVFAVSRSLGFTTLESPNKPAAGNAGIASRLTIFVAV
ncbi:MAG TPA: hypothetical protein VMS21_00785 [Methylomirabilota bacterium]|nr:hypothetical protein [Methylomirabilota bacterium]